MKDKYTLHCNKCDKLFVVKTDDFEVIQKAKCPFCKDDSDIFIREVKYAVEPDRTPITCGDRGCGTSGRFK